MASRKLSAAITVAGVALAVLLFVVLQDDDGSETGATSAATTTTEGSADKPKPEEPPKSEVAEIVVRNGQPAGGVAKLEFAKGERIRFVVRSDVSEEVHLHGYDISQDVEAGGRVEFDVPATIEGLFEVELEHSAVQLAEISVIPG